MPFGLKNARATYQLLVNHMFHPQLGRNVEVYVDDMLVKSLDEEEHLDNLQGTFDTLRRFNMKLNPSKCVFRVSSGKFLKFMVSHRGIEANPEKIKAILNMKPPQSIKEVQSLTGRVAALNSFVSKATDKCLPFFKVLKKTFKWTDECFPKSLPKLEDVPRYSSTAKSICDGRGVVLVPSSDPSCSEFSINTRRRKSAKARVLYKQSIEGNGRVISIDRKASLRANNSFQEATTLLLSLYNQCNDEPSTRKSHE